MTDANREQKQVFVGQSVLRLEDPPMVTGGASYAADINFPDQLHMRVVRSQHAHGEIVAIDATEALAMLGVNAVWTAADVLEIPPIDFREGSIEALDPYRQPVLATDRVRYVGEPVAVVFADDAYLAEDAAERVRVEIRELPVTLEADGEPGEFAPGLETQAAAVNQGYGDVEAAFNAAHKVVELEVTVGRHSGVPMETRGAIGRYNADNDMLEMHGAAKVPHKNRELLSRMLGRDQSSINLYEYHVGGGFGIRGEFYPEDVLVLVAAMRLGRPVKWIEDRYEHLMAANHSRNQHHKICAAVDSEGHILGINDEFYHDQGAYVRTHATRVVEMTCGVLIGPYKVSAYAAKGHFRLTNKTPAATYRAPARFETTFVRERLMDAISEAMEIDRIELRRRNLIPAAEMPFPLKLEALGDAIEYDSGDYEGLLDRALDQLDWEDLQQDVKRRRAAGEAVGVGIAMFVEKSGLGPGDGAKISVGADGKVEVLTGGASVGQGFETVMAQICADALGVDYRNVDVVHGQTDRIDYGIGAHASRATVVTGNAVNLTALKLREQALAVAAGLLQAPAEDLDIADGIVYLEGANGGASISLAEIAASLEDGLDAEERFHTEHQTYPYGSHLAVVSVDRGTGGVKVERFLIAYDIGRAINPMLVEGQIAGGFAQGLGGAILEEFIYDRQGQPMAANLADYVMPGIHETPYVELLLAQDHRSLRNPMGIKGAGEAGVTGVAAAIASAIDDAIGMPGAIDRIPVTPQRLMEILNGTK
ncbi:MAG: xanthine dehydrogenase family protein molybdopterin-binding subunit [Pseudomonadota bacterium]|nr:xanthine dehydrogenase family protein molybdopterin-binding subunit [Pseudomonadota bacterium]